MLSYGQELGLNPRGNENRGYAMLLGKKGTSIETWASMRFMVTQMIQA